MATDALDVLSLEMVKAELRIPQSETQHDELLTSHVAAGVAFVSKYLRAPLLDRAEGFRCFRPGDSAPIVLPTNNVRSVSSVRYWTVSGGSLEAAPDGMIPVGSLGRRVQHGGYVIYPPTSGWPVVLANSLIEIVVTRGMNTPPALRSAVALCVRQLYDGYREIRPKEAFWAMIEPWRSVADRTVRGFTP